MQEELSILSSPEQFDAIAAIAYKEVAVMKGQDWKYKVVCEPCAGYRANAGICVFDAANGKVLAFERLDHHSWQFPQGGIDNGETPIEAAIRELYEETAISREAVEVVAELPGWYHYDWPRQKQMQKKQYGCTNWRGQRQKWFVMRAKDVALVESMVDLSGHGAAQEFQRYAWVPPEHLLMLCREFKRAYFSFVIPDLQKVISGAGRHAAPPVLSSDSAAASNDGVSLQAALQNVSVKDAVQAVVAKFGSAAVLACLTQPASTVVRGKAAKQQAKVRPPTAGNTSANQNSAQRQLGSGPAAQQDNAQPPFAVGSSAQQADTQTQQKDNQLPFTMTPSTQPTGTSPPFAVGGPASIPTSFPVPSVPAKPAPVERSARTSITSNTSRSAEEAESSVDHTGNTTRSELDNSFAGIIEGMPTEMMRAPPT